MLDSSYGSPAKKAQDTESLRPFHVSTNIDMICCDMPTAVTPESGLCGEVGLDLKIVGENANRYRYPL